MKGELGKYAAHMINHLAPKKDIICNLIQKGLTENEANDMFREEFIEHVRHVRRIANLYILSGIILIVIIIVAVIFFKKTTLDTTDLFGLLLGLIPIGAGLYSKRTLRDADKRIK
jgi:hypothetical protein